MGISVRQLSIITIVSRFGICERPPSMLKMSFGVKTEFSPNLEIVS